MISVIVPIYNIEKYLPKCLDSLLAQTYPDVEFLLIDDGSTDKSRDIVDQYQKKDPRFRAFHTENHGLSAARNFGIEKARGDWLMFVDGDDRVKADFCRIPAESAQEHGADLVVFRGVSDKKRRKKNTKKDKKADIVSPEIATLYGGPAAWNKMYKRTLFRLIRYPEGKIYEDLLTTHKLVYSSHKIVLLNDILYVHVFRQDSITHTYSEQHIREHFQSVRQWYNELLQLGYPEEKARIRLWETAIGFLARTEPSDNCLYMCAESIVDSIPGIPSQMRWQWKKGLLVWNINKKLFHTICRKKRWKTKPV